MKHMNNIAALYAIRMKQAACALPKAMAGMVIFIALLCVLATGVRVMSESDEDEKMNVAICEANDQGEDSRYIRAAVDFAFNVEAVRDIAQVTYTDEHSALEGVRDGRYAAAAIIPDGFVSAVMSGAHNPIRVVFAESGTNVSSALFQEMVEAGAQDIGAAQIGIYSVSDTIRAIPQLTVSVYQTEMNLNVEYFSYGLDRDSYFEIETISGGESLGLVQIFVRTGIMVIIAMGGILCASLLLPDKRTFKEGLSQRGIGPVSANVSKIVAAVVIFFAMYAVIYVLICMSAMRYPAVADVMTAVSGFTDYTADGAAAAFGAMGRGLVYLLLTVLINTALAWLIYTVSSLVGTSGSVSGLLVYVIVYMAMFTLSGCIIDRTMLPDWMAAAGDALPTGWMRELVTKMMT